MSMAGGNPSLTVSMLADSSGLGTGLAQAEAQVRQSANRMGRAVDGALGRGLNQMFNRFTSAGFFLQIGDTVARGIADGIGKNRDIYEQIMNVATQAFESIPIAGALWTATRKQDMTKVGIGLQEQLQRLFLFGESQMGPEGSSQAFRSAEGGLIGQIPGLEQLLRSVMGDYFPKVGEKGTFYNLDPRAVEARIMFLQKQLEETERLPTRSELMSQQLSKVLGGSMGSVDTALGQFKFAQETTESTAQLVKTASKQVEIMLEIRKEMELLKKLTTAN